MVFKFVLPIPPSDNRRLMVTCYGKRFFNNPIYSDYKINARKILKQQLYEQVRETTFYKMSDFPIKLSYKNQYRVRITVYVKDLRRDITNMQKCLFDCLTDIIVDDDKYILPQFQPTVIDKNNPRVEVEL